MIDAGTEPEPGGFPRWLPAWAAAIGPVTLISAVLFYFGYVSSRAQYEYFGVDVDVIGLGTRDYIMRSPQPLLVPLLTLTLLGAGGLLVHLLLHRRVLAVLASPSVSDVVRTRRAHQARRITRAAITLGAFLLTSGIALLFAYETLQEWPAYALVTPALLICGASLVAYAWRFADLITAAAPASEAPAPVDADPAPGLRRSARFLVYLLLVTAIFWATATVAQLTGRGLAREVAADPERLPRVILDTRERLYLRNGIVEETQLPNAEHQEFRYRYRRLRLLVIGEDRMLLVPDVWSASNSTIIVPIDESMRMQFQFQNDAP
ncbi:hypothetical protein [Cryptosporangium minutisporangium]|uniref:DUF5671 domain-containing protein n=1 Tax=Cryptosporangium minutisporangium TaxID=113569 RepID=A0ABP6SR03_9ACTN